MSHVWSRHADKDLPLFFFAFIQSERCSVRPIGRPHGDVAFRHDWTAAIATRRARDSKRRPTVSPVGATIWMGYLPSDRVVEIILAVRRKVIVRVIMRCLRYVREEFASCLEKDRFKDCVSRRRKVCIVRFVVLLFRGMFQFKMIQYAYCNITLCEYSEFIFRNARERIKKVRESTCDDVGSDFEV